MNPFSYMKQNRIRWKQSMAVFPPWLVLGVAIGVGGPLGAVKGRMSDLALLKRFHSFDQAGHFTSACASIIYRDDLLFGADDTRFGRIREALRHLSQAGPGGQ